MDKYDHLDIDSFLTYLDYMIRFEDIDLEDQGGRQFIHFRKVQGGPSALGKRYVDSKFEVAFSSYASQAS